MKNYTLIILNLLFLHSSFSQSKVVLFSDEIKKHITKLNIATEVAYKENDAAKANLLFDSIVDNYLVGTKLENFTLKNIKGKKVKLAKINKPIFIITYSSWCVLNKAEIPALNKIAKKYATDFQLIVLFWNTKKEVQKISSKFGLDIKVCYANENYVADEKTVAVLKHYLGFPTSYFLNKNLEIVDIKRGNPQVKPKITFAKALDYSFNYFQDNLANFLLHKNVERETYVTTNNN